MVAEQQVQPRPFFAAVQSLRGLGAMAVAAYHISGWEVHSQQLLPHVRWSDLTDFQQAVGRVILALFPSHAALMMFFVISGFVLRVSLQYGPQTFGRAALRFHVARFFRIYPIVVVGMLLAAAAHAWGPPFRILHNLSPLTPQLLIANCLLLDVSLNGVLWALQVEILMIPIIFLLYFLEKHQGPISLLGVAVVTTVLSFFGQWAVFRPLSHNMFPFVLGMLLPTIGRNLVLRLSPLAARWSVASALLMFVLPAAIFGIYSRISAAIEGYAAALLVAIVAYRSDFPGAQLLRQKPLQLMGLCSGSYYVLHMMLIAPAIILAGLVVPATWSASMPVLTGIAIIVIWLVAISPLILLSYYVVEGPGIALGRYILRRWRLRPEVEASGVF